MPRKKTVRITTTQRFLHEDGRYTAGKSYKPSGGSR